MLTNLRRRPLLLAFMLGVSACSGPSGTPLERAQAHIAEGNPRAARVELLNALQADPDDRAALILLAQLDIARGDGVAAARSLDRIGASGSDRAGIAHLLAEANLLRDRCDDNAGLLDRIGAAHLADRYRIEGLCALRAGDAEAAKAALDAGLAEHPDDPGLLAARGRLALREGDIDAAEDYAGRAPDKAANFELAYLQGDIAAARGALNDAAGHYARAARINPLNLAPLRARGAALAELGKLDALARQVEELCAIAPDAPETLLLDARLKLARGDAGEAQTLLYEARKTLGSEEGTQLLAGEIALARGTSESAIQELSRLVAAEPANARARLLLARAYDQAGDASRAADTLRPIARRIDAPREYVTAMADYARKAGQPDAELFAARARFPSPELLAQRIGEADQAMQRGNWDAAILIYRDIEQATGRPNALVLNNRGWAHFQRGETDAALKALAAAHRLEPRNASIMDSYGWVLWKSGRDRARGVSLLERAARAEPGNANIRRHLREAGA